MIFLSKKMTTETVRDGTETLPEMADIGMELPLDRSKDAADEFLNEALLESFPASDPPSSGRME